MMRMSMKAAAERVLAAPGVFDVLLRRARGAAVVLAYHNVVPDDEIVTGEAPLHLAQARFLSHLDALQRYARIVPLQALVEVALKRDANEASRPSREPPRVALTFDDAYRGTLRVAVPELVARGLPATIFVPSGLVGCPSFWWDVVSVTSDERDEICLGAHAGDGERVMSWARETGRAVRVPGPFQRPASLAEVRGVAGLPGIRLAPHTAHHRNLARLEASEVRSELERDLTWFQTEGLPFDPWVAYPYGASSPAVSKLTGELVEAAFLVHGGGIRPGHHARYELPRVSIPAGASAENVLLRVVGLIKDGTGEEET